MRPNGRTSEDLVVLTRVGGSTARSESSLAHWQKPAC
jgi:hypothetical protein